jgi:hypothetical protein
LTSVAARSVDVASVPDPLGFRQGSFALARLGVRSFVFTERQVVTVLRAALANSEPAAAEVVPGLPRAVPASPPPPPAPAPQAPATLHDKLTGLLERALEQSTASSKQELYHRLLDRLLPDEARILSALSDGSVFPLVNVYSRNLSGLPGEPLLENACLVGRMANVSLPHLTPVYVSNLLSQGLVEVGPEDVALKDDYMILVADSAVLKAVKSGSRGPIAPPIERRTLQMSALGGDLWSAATGTAP